MSDKADSPERASTPPDNDMGGRPPGDRQAAGFADPSTIGGFHQVPSNRDYLDGFLFDAPPGAVPLKEPDAGAGDAAADGSLEERVVEALRAIYDPEIPVNIYDLGLIYGVEADDDAHVTVTMTLTTPHCPVAEIMPAEVEQRTRAVQGVSGATVNLVWDPPWDPSKMTEEAQLELGFI